MARAPGQALIDLGHKLATNIQSLEGVAVRCRRQRILSEADEVYKVVFSPHESDDRKAKIFLEAIKAAVCQDSKRLDTFMEILGLELQPADGSLLARVHEDLEDAIKRAKFGQCTDNSPNPLSNVTSQAVYVHSATSPSSQTSDGQDRSDKARKRVKLNATRSTEVHPVEATDKSPRQQQQQSQESFVCSLVKLFTQYDVAQERAKCNTLSTKVEMLEQKLKQQSSEYDQICADKKVIEEKLKSQRSEVNDLIEKQDEEVASLRDQIDELQLCMSENEKDRDELTIKCKELEQQLAETVDQYSSKISQREAEMEEKEENLAQLESVLANQKEKIDGLQQEMQKLICKNRALVEEVGKLRSQVFDFKSKNDFALYLSTFVVVVLVFCLVVIFTIIYHG